MTQKTFSNILLIRLSALGDVAHCLPALDALRRHYPAARICWVVEEKAAGLIEGHPQIDRVIVMPRRQWASALKNPLKWPLLPVGGVRFFAALGKEKFDLSIDFQGNFRSGLVSWLSGAKTRLGRARGHDKERSHVFATHHHRPPPRIHRTERALEMVKSLGVNIEGARAVLPVDPAAREAMRQWIKDAGKVECVVVMHPGVSAFGAFKRWDAEKYREVAGKLARENHALVALTWGGEAERRECEAIANAAGDGVRVAPKMSLKELAALLDEADLFIGGDTGPLHVAAALGTRVVGIYGPKDPVIYGPCGRDNVVVTSGAPCSPCTKRRCDDAVCMKNITAEAVLAAAKKALGEEKGKGKKFLTTD